MQRRSPARVRFSTFASLVATVGVATHPLVSRAMDGPDEGAAQPGWGELSGQPDPPAPVAPPPSNAAPMPGGQSGATAPWASYVGQRVQVQMDSGEVWAATVSADQGPNVSLQVDGVGLRVVAKQRVTSVAALGAAAPAGGKGAPAPVAPGAAPAAAAAEGETPPSSPPPGSSYQQALQWELKQGPYAKQRKNGGILAASGAIFAVIGMPLLAIGIPKKNKGDDVGEPLVVAGATLGVCGVLLAIGGAIVAANAKHKAVQRVRSAGFAFTRDRVGLNVAIAF